MHFFLRGSVFVFIMLLQSVSVYFEWWVLIVHVQTCRFPSESTCLSGRMCVTVRTVVWAHVGVQSCEEHLLLHDNFTCTAGWTAADVSLRTYAVIQRCSCLHLDLEAQTLGQMTPKLLDVWQLSLSVSTSGMWTHSCKATCIDLIVAWTSLYPDPEVTYQLIQALLLILQRVSILG